MEITFYWILLKILAYVFAQISLYVCMYVCVCAIHFHEPINLLLLCFSLFCVGKKEFML